MNWLGLTTVFLAFPALALGCWLAKRNFSQGKVLLCWCAGLVLALPATVYFVYYTGLFGEPIWFYELRTLPGTELLAFPAGFLAGWIQVRIVPRLRLSPWGTRLIIPIVLGFAIAVPYLKPLLRQPQPMSVLHDQWQNGVCLQSTFSTCGPASAATILHYLGVNATESELALASHTSARGTENWYLARAIRQYGLQTFFEFSKTLDGPLPAIVGVRLKANGNSGHFIALLEKHGNNLVFGDPMQGRFTNTLAELTDQYEFTGFMLSVQRNPKIAHD